MSSLRPEVQPYPDAYVQPHTPARQLGLPPTGTRQGSSPSANQQQTVNQNRQVRLNDGDEGNARNRSKSGPLGLRDDEMKELKATFDLFDEDQRGLVKAEDLKKAFMDVDMEAKNQSKYEIVSMLNRCGSEYINFRQFVDIVKSPSGDVNSKEEISRVFRLFDDDHTGTITFQNLERITQELGERYTKEELKEMISRASSDRSGEVTLEDFYKIMSKRIA